MTTIAYRDGVMCADTRGYSGWASPIGRKSKIHWHDGVLMGVSTRCVGYGPVVIDWYCAGMPGGASGLKERLAFHNADDGFTFLAVHPSGEAEYMLGYGLPARFNAPFYAIGSGDEYAMGAMEAGATVEEAVRIACKFDTLSELPIETLTHVGGPMRLGPPVRLDKFGHPATLQ